jgi:3-hydroxyisobutyrate dehydrogenase-like beta-hydroxyacid dehydrogenase
MVGGSAEDFQRAGPLLEGLACSLRHVGGTGQAAKVKALVETLTA